MTVYVDSSVLIRIVAGQAHPLRGWSGIEAPVSSVLIEVEAPRAIDRLRRARDLTDGAAVLAAAPCREALRAFQLVEIDAAVRLRAAGPFAVPLRSIDAIHIASALLWREANPDVELAMATHDERVARAAEAHGLKVMT